jgi:hypothetical protein
VGVPIVVVVKQPRLADAQIVAVTLAGVRGSARPAALTFGENQGGFQPGELILRADSDLLQVPH